MCFLETCWDGPTTPAPGTARDRGEVSDRQGKERRELGRGLRAGAEEREGALGGQHLPVG